MIKTRPGTFAAFAKADVPSPSCLSASQSAPDLQRDGCSTTSEDKLFRMSVHA